MKRFIRWKTFKVREFFWEFVTVVVVDPILAIIGGSLFSIMMVILYAFKKNEFTIADRHFIKKLLEDNGVTEKDMQECKDPDGCLRLFPLSRRVLLLYWDFISRLIGIDF